MMINGYDDPVRHLNAVSEAGTCPSFTESFASWTRERLQTSLLFSLK